MKENNTRLIRPPISPPMYNDESPISYLIRVAELNQYKHYHWLVGENKRLIYPGSHHKLYKLLSETEWAGCDLQCKEIKSFLSLKSEYFLSNKLRYCPECIKSYGYYKMQWQYKTSLICSEHLIWLHDSCHHCDSDVALKNSKIKECICSTDITNAPQEKVTHEVKLLNDSLEGSYQKPYDDELIIDTNHQLNLKQRIDVINFFSRWLESRLVNAVGISRQLREISTARKSISDAAEALFVGQSGFHNFLRRLHDLGSAGRQLPIDLFTRFYRAFYKEFDQPCFDPYKKYLEKYLNEHWQKSLTCKNSNFSSETIKNHPWISLKVACAEYNIHKSQLKLAIRKKLIRNRIDNKETRNFTLLYRPDIESRLYRIRDLISHKEAAQILGLSKGVFSKLKDHAGFKVVIPPDIDGSSVWQFSKSEIEEYLHSFIDKLAIISGDYWTFSQTLQFFGCKLDNSTITILKAIRSKELNPVGISSHSLAGILFDKTEFKEWLNLHKRESDLFSIPQLSKRLGLQQEFTYQLVDNCIIKTTLNPNNSSKWVSQKNIDEFHREYILLSKLAKITNIHSRTIMKILEGMNIFPIDNNWKISLRQKVYKKEHLINLYEEFL